MADFDPGTGAFVVPWWGAVAILALVVALAVLAVMRAGGARALSMLVQLLVGAVVLFAGWTILDRLNQRDRADERRALDVRMEELAARAMVPGSPLGCLDPVAADALDETCEKALFANAESIAGAIAFVSARLTLLSDMADFDAVSPGKVDQSIAGLRRWLERDRYGFVAYVLATRESCTEERCDAFALFNDTGRIVNNLRGHAFETRLERASANWAARPAQAVVAPPAAAPQPTVANPGPAAPPAPPVAANVNFPSANSIPPVSIMNNEPGFTGQNGVEDSRSDARAEAKPAPKRPAEKPAPRRAHGAGTPIPISPAPETAAARAQ